MYLFELYHQNMINTHNLNSPVKRRGAKSNNYHEDKKPEKPLKIAKETC